MADQVQPGDFVTWNGERCLVAATSKSSTDSSVLRLRLAPLRGDGTAAPASWYDVEPRRMFIDCERPLQARRHLIIAEGDGQPVTRVSRKFPARAAVYSGDTNGDRLELEVDRFGRWSLSLREHGNVTTVADGRFGQEDEG